MSTKDFNLIHLSEVSSTNDYAKELLGEERPPEGTLITTDFQTAGKGQDKNAWESEAEKNILMTMIFYPDFLDVSKQFNISISVALGIIDFLSEMLPLEELSIKWPNDIYVGQKKIGGILINNEIMGDRFEHVIAGIGINVNQKSFSKDIPNPVSISMLTTRNYDLPEETWRLCDCVRKRYEELKQTSFDKLRVEYHENLLGMNDWKQYIYQEKKITAKIIGVNEFGKLLLETKEGMIECDIREIVYIL